MLLRGGEGQLGKGAQEVQGLCGQVPMRVKFQERDEMWLNIKNFQLPEGLSHKFLGPYAGPFKVLENKLFDTYKLELPENLRVHPTFHVSLLKSVSRDASKPN
jgi:hypothetical protein